MPIVNSLSTFKAINEMINAINPYHRPVNIGFSNTS